ncbi:MAG: hypothetical protein ABR553_09685 [Gammaproteobacteria bacterium]
MAHSETQEFDWVGYWFALLKERGGNDLFTVVRHNLSSGETQYVDYSHSTVDGVGGLMAEVEKGGQVFDPPELGGALPSWRQLLRSTPAFLRSMRSPALPWRLVEVRRQPQPHDFAFIVFDKPETRALQAHVRAHRYSLAAYLLSRVHGVLGPRYLREDVPARWLFPINMRGPIRRTDPKSNHSTGIPLVCRFDTTPEELRAQMRQGLRDNLHWWAWHALHIGKLIGVRGMRWLSKREQTRHVWMGSFTIGGEWPRRGGVPLSAPDEILIGIPPGSPGYPIGVASVIWNGHFCMALKLHPMIEPDPSAAAARLDELRAVLLADAATEAGA